MRVPKEGIGNVAARSAAITGCGGQVSTTIGNWLSLGIVDRLKVPSAMADIRGSDLEATP